MMIWIRSPATSSRTRCGLVGKVSAVTKGTDMPSSKKLWLTLSLMKMTVASQWLRSGTLKETHNMPRERLYMEKTMKTIEELDVELTLLKIDIERQYESLSNLKQRKSFLLTSIANATAREGVIFS
jgi:hypothetical protein